MLKIKSAPNKEPSVIVSMPMNPNIPMAQVRDDAYADAKALFQWMRATLPGATFDEMCKQFDMYDKMKKRGLL